MPTPAQGQRLRTKDKPNRRPRDQVIREEALDGFTPEVKLKEMIGRLYEIGKLLAAGPLSKLKKRELQRMLDQIWLLLPDPVQLVARKDLPEKVLYGVLGNTLGKEEDDAAKVIPPPNS